MLTGKINQAGALIGLRGFSAYWEVGSYPDMQKHIVDWQNLVVIKLKGLTNPVQTGKIISIDSGAHYSKVPLHILAGTGSNSSRIRKRHWSRWQKVLWAKCLPMANAQQEVPEEETWSSKSFFISFLEKEDERINSLGNFSISPPTYFLAFNVHITFHTFLICAIFCVDGHFPIHGRKWDNTCTHLVHVI